MQSVPIPPKAIQIFYSYADEDEWWQKKLEQQFSVSKRNGLVSHWHHGLIDAGKERQQKLMSI